MKQNLNRNSILFLAAAVIIWIASPVYSSLNNISGPRADSCPSGRSEARLTGWMFNNKMPIGLAVYDEKTKQLEVKITNVALPDGERLNILIGFDRIGETSALAGGAATTVVTQTLKEGDRVSIFEGERALVSANLACVKSTADPTPTPAPTASPSPTTSPSPAPTSSPMPVPPATPTATPMPSPTLR